MKKGLKILFLITWLAERSIIDAIWNRFPPREIYAATSGFIIALKSEFEFRRAVPLPLSYAKLPLIWFSWFNCNCSSSAIVWKIVGTISTTPSQRHKRQHWTYLKLSLKARSNMLKNLTWVCTTEIHLKSCLNKSRNVNKHLPLITIPINLFG